MDTNRNDLFMPSGMEVEAANLHSPGCSCTLHSHHVDSSTPGWRDKLNSVKSEVAANASLLRGQFVDKKSELMSTVSGRVTALRSSVRDRANAIRTRVDNELRTNTGKWTGIVAGAGAGLGLLSRLIRHRMQARTSMPEVLIISSC